MTTDKRKVKGKKEVAEAQSLDSHQNEIDINTDNDMETVVRRVVRSELKAFKAELDSFKTELRKIMDDKLGMLERKVAAIEQDTGVTDLRSENESLRKQLSLHTERLDELE